MRPFQGRACHHNAELDLEALGARLGFDFEVTHWWLAPKLRCTACGSREVSIRIGVDTTPNGWKAEWEKPQRL